MNKTARPKINRIPNLRIPGPLHARMETEIQDYLPIAWSFVWNILWAPSLNRKDHESNIKSGLRTYLKASGCVFAATMELCVRALITEHHFAEHAGFGERLPKPKEWLNPAHPLGIGDPKDWRQYWSKDGHEDMSEEEEFFRGLALAYVHYICEPTKKNYGIISDSLNIGEEASWPARIYAAILDYHHETPNPITSNLQLQTSGICNN